MLLEEARALARDLAYYRTARLEVAVGQALDEVDRQIEDLRRDKRSPEATSSEEGGCGETRTIDLQERTYITNDVSGCPKGGLLSGTDGRDKLDGEDEIRGLGAVGWIYGGLGSDVIYGGDGDDLIDAVSADLTGSTLSKERDEVYCGEGKDRYIADKLDHVDHSCEKKIPPANL